MQAQVLWLMGESVKPLTPTCVGNMQFFNVESNTEIIFSRKRILRINSSKFQVKALPCRWPASFVERQRRSKQISNAVQFRKSWDFGKTDRAPVSAVGHSSKELGPNKRRKAASSNHVDFSQ